jgi:hypothetical protein
MRNISFQHTESELLAGRKTVTRRLGWAFLKAGDRLCAVRKARGLRPDEKLVRLGVIEVVSIRREKLELITEADCALEGYAHLAPASFVAMFCKTHRGCEPGSEVTRIEFKRIA